MKAFSNFIAPASDTLESPLSSIFICSLWCLSACLCLLLTLVRVCVYSPSCLIFPHSLSAFIIMKVPKQLQPSQQEPRDSCSSTHAVSFLSHTFCSAQPPSSPLVSISCGIGLNKGMMQRLLFGGLGGKWNPPQGDL